MITLYRGSGAADFFLDSLDMSEEGWDNKRRAAIALLRKRNFTLAADLLDTYVFSVMGGLNSFGDEFLVLFRTVGLDDYIMFGEHPYSDDHMLAYKEIARTLGELQLGIRFIAVELDTETSPRPVQTPVLKITSLTVENALSDAEQMVKQGRPVSAVDRAHTALQGFLKQVCVDSGLAATCDDLNLTNLVKLLQKGHPAFSTGVAQGAHADKVLKAMSTICDALNPIRNRGSLAHPNEELLGEPEAMLAINASRTILLYVYQRLESVS